MPGSRGRTEAASAVALRLARGVVKRLPQRMRRRLDDGLFYAIFQVTRVTNDNYGWRPPPPGGGTAEE